MVLKSIKPEIGGVLDIDLPREVGLLHLYQGAQVRTLCSQNERNVALDLVALTSIFGLCFMPGCIIKSNC